MYNLKIINSCCFDDSMSNDEKKKNISQFLIQVNQWLDKEGYTKLDYILFNINIYLNSEIYFNYSWIKKLKFEVENLREFVIISFQSESYFYPIILGKNKEGNLNHEN